MQGLLLETMSFVEALPAFRVKQWQVISLLFIDALSVCRIPTLTPHMTNRTMLLRKVRPHIWIFILFEDVLLKNKIFCCILDSIGRTNYDSMK